MDFEYLSRDASDSIMSEGEEEDEGFGKFSSVPLMLNGDAEEQLERRRKHVYENFVSDVLDELEEDFEVEDVQEAIRPPYNSEEISNALEYGVDKGDLVREDDTYNFSD
jgi:hypothetical protein